MSVGIVTESLPHSDEAERSVLGSVLLDNNQYHKARELLSPESFYSNRHQKVFNAFERLMEGGTALDLLTVKSELERVQELEACGGPA